MIARLAVLAALVLATLGGFCLGRWSWPLLAWVRGRHLYVIGIWMLVAAMMLVQVGVRP